MNSKLKELSKLEMKKTNRGIVAQLLEKFLAVWHGFIQEQGDSAFLYMGGA